MEYNRAMEYMNEIAQRGSSFDLSAIKQMLSRLGNPQDQLKVIHVAGTNGKGSICSFLAALYEEEGKTVGRYISPTIHDYLERFQINGSWMEPEAFGQLFESVYSVYKEMETEGQALPTAFELETVIAFCYFVKQHVDYVILETGMGGRMDATNVVKEPLCTVFASIAMDHMQFLGESVEEIAREKAGIMRDNCPVIAFPSCDQAIQVLKEESAKHGSMITVMNPDKLTIISETLEGSQFVYEDEEYSISLAGNYQIYNAVVAILCKLQLDGSLKKEALNKVRWEGRFEKIGETPLFIKDGAHNIDGAEALRKSIQKHFTNYRIIFIIGVLRDKEYEKMMQCLCPLAQDVFTITPDNPRGLDKDELKCCIEPICGRVQSCDNIEMAVEKSVMCANTYRERGEKSVVIAWGSLSYIGLINQDMLCQIGVCLD